MNRSQRRKQKKQGKPRAPARPDSFRNELDRGMALHSKNDVAGALAIYRTLLESVPDDSDLLHLIGLAEFQSGRVNEAHGFLRRALELAPDREAFWNHYGLVLAQSGQAKEAEAAFRKAIELNDQFAPPLSNLADLLVSAGKRTDAIELYRQALKRNPESVEALCNLGNALHGENDLAEAEQCFRRVIELAPNLADGPFNLGNVLLDLDGYQASAIEAYQKAVELQPGHVAAWTNLGMACRRAKRFDEARQAYDRAITLEPDNAAHYRGLGNVFIDDGREADALDPYRKAVELDPDNGFGKHILASLEGKTPVTAPESYVTELFDQFSGKFEKTLFEELGYNIPQVIKEKLVSLQGPEFKLGRVLDLGCGTGMVGESLRKHAEKIDGIDLSPKMIEKTSAKDIYAQLWVGNITEVPSDGERYDLIVAADVFIYVGDLQAAFALVCQRATPGGLFAFSTELNDNDEPFFLRPTGRYAHSHEYIEQLATSLKLETLVSQELPLRKEADNWLTGELWILKMPN